MTRLKAHIEKILYLPRSAAAYSEVKSWMKFSEGGVPPLKTLTLGKNSVYCNRRKPAWILALRAITVGDFHESGTLFSKVVRFSETQEALAGHPTPGKWYDFQRVVGRSVESGTIFS